MNTGTHGGRAEARERAVQLAYECEQRELEPEQLLAEQIVTPDPYTVMIVAGVVEKRADIDSLLTTYADRWPLMRMPALDRAALRVATYELLECGDVPTAVILNEAVEFAKTYSTEDSSRFVNGVLSSIANATRP